MAAGKFESTIGYQETCDALEIISGVAVDAMHSIKKVACNRKLIRMQAGDEALVFRLTCRLSDPALKGRISNLDFILKNSEIGIMRKEE